MALAKMSWDELNQLVGYKRSEPFDEYFEPMQISEEQKEERIALAERLYEVFVGLLLECFYADQLDTVIAADIHDRTRNAYLDAVEGSAVLDDYIYDHAIEIIETVIQVLQRHDDDPYYYSDDRGRVIAENESNLIIGHEELEEAMVSGYRYKTWNTIMDGRERDSHADVNGTTIPIDEPFELAGGLMMQPLDSSLGASDEEICGCRCSLSFS